MSLAYLRPRCLNHKTKLSRSSATSLAIITLISRLSTSSSDSNKHSQSDGPTEQLIQLLSNIHNDPSSDPLSEHPSSSSLKLPTLLKLLNLPQISNPEFDVLSYLTDRGYEPEARLLVHTLVDNWKRGKAPSIALLTMTSKQLVRGKPDFCILLIQLLINQGLCIRPISRALQLPRVNTDENRSLMVAKLIDMSRLESSTLLADLLIRLALSQGQPLIATSLCVRFCSTSILSLESILSTIGALLVRNPDYNLLHLKALQTFQSALNNSHHKVQLTSKIKSDIVSLGLLLSEGTFPSLANDSYELAKSFEGEPIPISPLFKLLQENLQYSNPSRAAKLWKDIMEGHGKNFAEYSPNILALVIRKFSETKTYSAISRVVAHQIPEEMYNIEGLTEALLIYCARNFDEALAVKVYERIETPIRRSVLGNLLNLHLRFNDTEGAERILAEISRRGDILQPVEFSFLVQTALKSSLEKGVQLVKDHSPSLVYLSYGAVIDAAISEGNDKVADEFMDLALKYAKRKEVFDQLAALTLKRASISKDSFQARNHWQKWLVFNEVNGIGMPSKQNRLVALRTIADQALRERNGPVFDWVINEARLMGVYLKDILSHMSHRDKFFKETISRFKRDDKKDVHEIEDTFQENENVGQHK